VKTAISVNFLLKGTVWTIGSYIVSSLLRLVTNVVLSRLLAPELFGIMLIVYSLRLGLELISDVGIGQNIVYNKNAENPEFYNTAWTLQLLRSFLLWLVFLVAGVPTAEFYHTPILVYVVPITAFGLVFSGFTAVGKTIAQKRLQVVKLSIFDAVMMFISSAGNVIAAYFSPTIWALVFGGLFGSATSTIGSYFLLPEIKQRFYLSKQFFWEIIHFGKWIFLSSIVVYLSTYIDRLYLGKVISLELVGIYGIARSLSDLTGNLVLRLGHAVVFPFIASHSQTPRAELRAQLAPLRLKFLLLAGLGFSFFVATADFVIKILYDERYHAAMWMLPILVVGSWFSTLATINESTLLGLGKPSYSAFSNGSKFVFLLVGLWLGVKFFGVLGGVGAVALGNLCGYIPILIGQLRERFSFGMQDFLVTLAVFALIALWEGVRWAAGFGTSFDSLPILTL
jgi:O-antigen/teichoic acid export membrane protein